MVMVDDGDGDENGGNVEMMKMGGMWKWNDVNASMPSIVSLQTLYRLRCSNCIS